MSEKKQKKRSENKLGSVVKLEPEGEGEAVKTEEKVVLTSEQRKEMRRLQHEKKNMKMTASEKKRRSEHIAALGREELMSDKAFAKAAQKYRHMKDEERPLSELEKKPASKLEPWEVKQIEREKKMYDRAVAMDKQAAVQAAVTEVLQTESRGYIEPEEEGERTDRLKQKEIAEAVDIQSSGKAFDLQLTDFGPYVHDYTRSGRYLLLGGRKGHLAVMDWQKKDLVTEIHVNETIRDVKFLQNEGMFAVAQKRWVHIYDRTGAEMHCLEKFRLPLALEYLPYHFLLASSSEAGRLRYIDISTGKELSELVTHMGPCGVMAQNPWNAVLCLGHTRGCVTMWSPNQGKPLVKMICHRGPIQAVAVNRDGMYMATAGVDSTVKIWDIRTLKPLATVPVRSAVTSLSISQTGLLAAGSLAHVNIWRESLFTERIVTPYLTHTLPGSCVERVRFCPYEDFLGIGHRNGYTSMIVPGAGEANYDTFEANPFETRRLRRETEVHQLLEKIPAEMITLNPGTVGTVASKAEVELKRKQILAEAANYASKKPAAEKREREESDSEAEDADEVRVDNLGEGEGEDGVIIKNDKKKHKSRKARRARKILIFDQMEKEEKELKRRAKKAKHSVSQVDSALDLFTKKVRY